MIEIKGVFVKKTLGKDKLFIYFKKGEEKCVAIKSWDSSFVVERLSRFPSFSFIPKEPILVNNLHEVKEVMDNFKDKIDLFKESIRIKHKRVVYIVVGPSNLGKTYLTSHLKGLSVYETDDNSVLPVKIGEDVIVIGNKYPYSIREIELRIPGDHESVIVTLNPLFLA